MNRSGQVFAPRIIEFAAKAKEKEIANNIPMPTANIESQGKPLFPKVAENQKEAKELLRMIKKSDYKVVDQLKQTPPKISMLSLLLSSEAYRKSLTKVLSASHIQKIS